MKVVAISAPSGCGKTSIVKKLAEQYACPCLYFDDYIDELTYPKNMKQWLNMGANTSAIQTPSFVQAIKQSAQESADSTFIFVEEPFGRCRSTMASLIDHVVLLDVPLEVCLARVLERNMAFNGEKSLTLIAAYLTKYNDYLRDIYLETTRQTRQGSDFIINDIAASDVLVAKISQWLEQRAGN